MRTCVVWGDMAADRASDQYLTVVVCDRCVAEDKGSENPQILKDHEYDSSYGDRCHFCEKRSSDE